MELTETIGYDEWYEENATELWAAYHEQGANYDQAYEEWCEKQYELKTNKKEFVWPGKVTTKD